MHSRNDWRTWRIVYLLGGVCGGVLLVFFLRPTKITEVPSRLDSSSGRIGTDLELDTTSQREATISKARIPWPSREITWPSRGCTSSTPKKWYSQEGEDRVMHELLYRNVCRGTFVELGAYDGVEFSITKAYEDGLQWTGLLIEATPRDAAKLKINRPHVNTVHSATCLGNQTTVKFAGADSPKVGGIAKAMTKEHAKYWHIDTSKYVEVPCAPLGKLLQRANLAVVDMFILDVESGEYDVLLTMDWRVPVGVWVVELDGKNKVKDNRVRALLQQHGYVELPVKGMHWRNSVFFHPSYKAHLDTLKMS